MTSSAFRTLAAALLLALSTPIAAQADPTGDQITGQLRAFYAYYVHTADSDSKPSDKVMRGYVSARLLKEIARLSKVEGGIEADPYLSAQDFDKAWGKNVAVEVSGAAAGKATAKVTLSGGEMSPHHLKLKMIEEGGAWKIDRVEDLDLH